MDKTKIFIKATGKTVVVNYDRKLTRDDNGKWRIENETYTTDDGTVLRPDEVTVIPWEPFELFGFEIGDGWHELMQPIIKYVEKYNEGRNEAEKMKFCQVKAKFGTLRVYMNFTTKELDELIDKAKGESAVTCEICGSKKKVGHTIGWITTMCYGCVKKNVNKNGQPRAWHNYDAKTTVWVNPGETADEPFKKEELP